MAKPRGRPKLYDTQASARIYLGVTPAQHLELRRVARENGVSLAGVIRDAVNTFVADYDERHPFPRRRP